MFDTCAKKHSQSGKLRFVAVRVKSACLFVLGMTNHASRHITTCAYSS
jgi:hypothetical protein